MITTPDRAAKYGFVDYSSLPEHMQDGARDYVERGYGPGSFLRAVLGNDLVGAFGHADEINLAAMTAWASWLSNEVPHGCWGSAAKVDAWLVAAVTGPNATEGGSR